MSSSTPRIIYLMGVSGSGKTTIGKALSEATGMLFTDGDEFHPPANIKKMASGHPLQDSDRMGWLQGIQAYAKARAAAGESVIIACSALKEKYRQLLSAGLPAEVQWVYLHGSLKRIQARLQERRGHFMPPGLLASQFDSLEPPEEAIWQSINPHPDQIVAELKKQLKL